MPDTTLYDLIREAALADMLAGAEWPSTLPTVELQNWYDLNRLAGG
jgi:hypothetical protein